MQTARACGADVLLISEQHKWSENSAWYQDASRRAGIIVCSPVVSIGNFPETDVGFIWVVVAGVGVYSCYFSLNDPFDIFETQILLLEESLREASGRSLIADDFNSKLPEWGAGGLDRRGILVGKMVARNDLIVSNRGRNFTFRRGTGGSITHLRIAAPRLASRVGDWCALEVITLSDHRCIEFSIQERSHPMNMGGKASKGNDPTKTTGSHGRRAVSRKGRSTVDGIQAVVDIATKARRETGKREGFCALISIDIRNAFNSARWYICIEAMVRKKVPGYLLRMIDDM